MQNSVHEVRAIAKEARDNGAYKCAPRELALAETHIEFTERELDQGDYFRARDHLHIADHNAREAYQPVAARQVRGARRCRPTPTATASPTTSTSARPSPRTRTASRTRTAAPIPTTTRTASPTRPTSARTSRRTRTASRTRTAAPIPTTTTTASSTTIDKCPNEPEDKDGFEDEDGCPDPDNDKDGVLDAADKCPNDPGPPDNDGCPKKYEHIVVTQEKIELKQKIFFDTNKATIQPRSFALLDEVASVLKSRPTMTVRIEGHTDSRGKHEHNMKLSQSRAESVRQHLVGLGIDLSRMEAKGYGPDQPIETNKTAAGREKNRRVEFFITQQ